MPDYKRFAIYAAPPPGPLADRAAEWLGWDPAIGRIKDHPRFPDLPRPLSEITTGPGKYGFHATLKPPFRLTDDSNLTALKEDTERLASRLIPVRLDGLALNRVGGFLALVPIGDTSALNHLASDVVRDLDSHRAALSESDHARYSKNAHTAMLLENLALWGYPRVMEAFRFHFTLTDRLPKSEQDAVKATLAQYLLPLLPRPFTIDSLCLFAECADARFHILARYPLGGRP